MKTGLGLRRKYRKFIAYLNFIRFSIRKILIGFDVANIFLRQVDKYSVLLILKKYGASIGKNCDIETGLTFHNCINYKNLIIGNNCHIGKNCFFDLRDKITIGDNVVISMNSVFITHLDLSKSNLSNYYPPKTGKIIIEDNSYIGCNSTILEGVTIYKNAFVASCALVNKDVSSYTLVGGIPAKLIREINLK